MDHSLIVPRLRLTRHHPRMKQDTSSTPIPGPSRLYTDDFLAVPDDDNDDSQSTPRLSNHAKLASEKNSPIHQTAPPLTADTPAARLRALLARVPNNTPPASSRTYRPPSPSDLESDFEPVESSSNTPSIARESLKELFSHALRDPGDTPQKGRRRRNSVDASPVVDKTVERERAYNRGKRQSMSDEEAEKIAQIARRGERSSRTSGAAATFDALRERLAQASSSSSSKPPTEDAVSSGSEVPMDVSEDTTTVLKHFTGNVSIPPDATSTPMRSVQMPLMQSQSNLLEQDSEMHRAMRELDSYDEESQSLQQRKLNFPPLREQKGHSTSPARPLSWSSHSKSHSSHNLPLARRVSEEFESSSSRASSNMSASEFQDRRTEAEQERMHERERAWKFPSKTPAAPGTPERPRHQHSHSSPSHPSKPDTPAYSRSRRSSAASMQSFDDGNSSRASSTSSRSEYRSRMKEEEEEKNKERERLWNMPVHARARTTSSLSMNSERSRTNSTPSRSGSAQGYLSPVHITQNHSLTRKLSITSLSGSSRPSSPSHPVEVVKEVVQHIRERNWNSPHPNWKADRRRSISPLPDSPEPAHSTPREVNGSHSRFPLKPRKSFDALSHSHSPHSSPQAKPTPSRDKGKERARADSLTTSHSHKSPSTSASATRTLAAHRQSHAHSPTDRPKSPKPSHPPETAPPPPSSPSKIPNFKARFGWSFPHNQSKPTSEADDAGPLVDNHQPPPRSPSPLRAISLSRIPTSSSSHSVKSPENGQTVQRKKGHKRTSTEFGEAVGRVPPRIQVFEDGELEPVPIVGEHDQELVSSASPSTPLARPIVLPASSDATSRSPPPATNGDVTPSDTATKPPSPPRSPPPNNSSDISNSALQTPPRKPSFHTSKLEFQTPSPPRNMPDLPGPPSSSDIEDHDDDRTPVNRSNDVLGTLNFSTMKTPRPPGAWATTPLPSERDIIVRPSSTPPYRTNGSSSTTTPSPLATTPAPRAATLSRADSLPTQTPAPPGAWLATPANSSARRKSILKVRFDIDPGELESDTSMLDVTPPPTRKVVPPSMKANGDSGNVDEKGVKRETSPKSVSVRLLDAFGRETEVLDAPSQLSSSRSPPPAQSVASTSSQHQHRPDLPPPPVTPRSKSAIRIVDAMGREVEEPPEEPLKLENGFANGNGDARLVVRGRKKQEDRELDWNPDSRMVLSHNEALARVRRTIADLAGDLDEVDRSYDNLALDENRLGALEDASRAAKSARKRISDSLRYVQTAEDDLKMKFGSLRRGMNESKFLPSVQRTNGVTWARVNTWTVCAFLVIQLLLMVLMYRYSFVRARKMFLSTYYDGFNVDLYLHLTSHSPHYSPTPSNPFSWSSETTWSDVWGNVTTLVGDWAVQVVRREENVSGSWPPT